ncbi:IS66 family insertion sequence element accessory protein TnpA [Tumebacillus flagellatus]|uniref:Transposase n=1 Tax=Tumebacillus flagellatus TaxID=1157490 RepID=A0A074LWM0_9BACL|nr:hypothetical protein [Tumebacillus flagellatus]KEO85289.1 hypothetical protein EL26_01650 [Tumebacillus flagellatus]
MAQPEIKKTLEARIADFRASGLSGSQWCEQNQIATSQFYYWKRKLMNMTAPSSQWVTLQVQPSSLNDPSLFVTVGPAVIEVKPGFDRDLFSDVVRTLQTLC